MGRVQNLGRRKKISTNTEERKYIASIIATIEVGRYQLRSLYKRRETNQERRNANQQGWGCFSRMS